MKARFAGSAVAVLAALSFAASACAADVNGPDDVYSSHRPAASTWNSHAPDHNSWNSHRGGNAAGWTSHRSRVQL